MTPENNIRPIQDLSLRDLLSKACLLVQLPPLTDVHVDARSMGSTAGAADLQDLLDQILYRHDELVVLADRLSLTDQHPRVPTALRVILEPAIAGCVEAARTLAAHLRGQINGRLLLCLQDHA